ncbi:hypothetical protein QQ045_005693 [Rhodiola kirilowii]
MRRLKWLIGAMFVVVVVFQCFEALNSTPASSFWSSLRIQFEAKNVSQIEDSPFVSHFGGSSTSSETPLRDGTYLNTDLSLQNDQGKENDTLNEQTDLGERPLSNGTLEVNGTSTTGDVIRMGVTERVDKTMEPVPEQSLPPSNVEEAGGAPPTNAPSDERTTTENGNGRLTSPPLTPVDMPSAVTPAGNIEKNDTLKDLAKVQTPAKEETVPLPEVVSITQMNDLLRQSHRSYRSMKPWWPSAVDEQILFAKSQIENAPFMDDPNLYAPLYRNVSMFRRSYEQMEQILKVYIYREGKSPVFHRPPLKGIYASEGWFMKHMEANKKFVTKDPAKAHLFYIPFSSRQLEESLYVQNSHSMDNLIAFLNDYLNTIMGRYPYWNRTGGSDHFVVACHDWAAYETGKAMPNSIRALCNSDVKEGYKFGKDVSLAETNVRLPKNLLADIGGRPPSQRDTLAFFAGRMHGYLRPLLIKHWADKDPDMKIFGKLPKSKHQRNYIQYMKSSKYCICARGYEVNSPRVVEAIFFDCVPVIISDNFVPPFFEILNWESFAVFVPEKDVPNLKTILLSISEKRYIEMHRRVKKVQQHFLWHAKPEKYDIFHMILHSIWFNRVFTFQP